MNISFTINDFFLITPILIIFVTSLVPISIKVLRPNYKQPPNIVLIQACLGIIFSAFLVVLTYGGKPVPTAFNNTLVFDSTALWTSAIILLVAAGCLLLMHENISVCGDQFPEIIFLVLNSIIGVLVLIVANDLMTIFLGLEFMSLPLYITIFLSRERVMSKEAALKYFILGSFASALFLYGLVFTFGVLGTTNLTKIGDVAIETIKADHLFLIGFSLLLLGFAFKVAIFPLHAWLPDVYQGAPTSVTAFMATVVKSGSFIAFLRIILTKGLIGSELLTDVFQWLAVLTMIIGNIGALKQEDLKRMLAYSSIAHSGYLLIGIITVGISEKSELGISALILYLLAYVVMALGAFAIICAFEHRENVFLKIQNLQGLARRQPWVALAFTIMLLSLAGVPPLIGFFGKFYIFMAAISEGLLWLAIWGVINSVIGVYYYIRPAIYMYMKEGEPLTTLTVIPATFATFIAATFLVVILGFCVGVIL